MCNHESLKCTGVATKTLAALQSYANGDIETMSPEEVDETLRNMGIDPDSAMAKVIANTPLGDSK